MKMELLDRGLSFADPPVRMTFMLLSCNRTKMWSLLLTLGCPDWAIPWMKFNGKLDSRD